MIKQMIILPSKLQGEALSRAALVSALAPALLLTACSQHDEDSASQALARMQNSAPTAGLATSILNAGIMTELGQTGEGVTAPPKFLFDPLYDDHFGSLEQLTEPLIEAIVTGQPPYDGVTAVFVSHAHGDHFSASQLTRMLAEQPDLVMVAPLQAIERMQAEPAWRSEFAVRTRPIRLANGEQSESFEIAGAVIEAFRSPHNGWPESHSNVHNITYRVSAPLADGLVGRVMHLGDADPDVVHYQPHAAFLSSARTGLVMVPYWFYTEEDLDGLIADTLNAELPVAMHVPVRVPGYLSSGDLPYFSDLGEQLPIPPSE